MNCVDIGMKHALELRGLSKVYRGVAAVDDVDLNLGAGESLAIIGHNGAGKTTLMKLILQLVRPTAGSIERGARRFDAPDIQRAAEPIGFLPESVAFPGTLSGRQMLQFYARLKHIGMRECEELLDLVGLSEAAGQKINTYSKGMRQRLGLAQALLGDPDLLLLDEPTSGLDPMLRNQFYEIVAERQASGTSVIISSHALTEIEARTDRIAIMKAGRIIVQGSLGQLRTRAAMPVRIVLTLREGRGESLLASLDNDIAIEYSSEEQLVICCREDQKLKLIHQLTAQTEAVLDLVLRPPRLDDLYAHFVNGGEP